MKVLYLQYANPAAYPPLEHSSRIFADNGWEVLVLGSASHGTEALRFPPHPKIEVRMLRYCPPGWRQKLHFFWFVLWVWLTALRWRPKWIYVSDPLSCPVALLLSFFPRWQLIYHEHDSPAADESQNLSRFMRFVLWARRQAAQRVAFCILPSQRRAQLLTQSTETSRPVFCVWNCPSRQDVALPVLRRDRFTVYYHGNIGPELVPVSLLEALAAVPGAHLLVIGYAAIGSDPHLETLRRESKRLKITERVEIRPPLCRRELLEEARMAHVGWAVIPTSPDDVNLQHIVGASNKVFDYLACSLPVLVLNSSRWVKTFVNSGYGLTCDPQKPDSITSAIRWLIEHPEETRQMGKRGRERILTEWNYEVQFSPVLRRIADS